MQTKEQVTEGFKADLQAVLDKWEAELSAEDHYPGWPEAGEDIRMTAVISGRYTASGDTARDYTEIDLGRYLLPSKTSG
jgi:hypothetical protein